MNEPPVLVTNHAQERAAVRHPNFWRERGTDGIYVEVVRALADGRRAKTQPRWSLVDGERRKKADRRFGTGLYVWNAEETRCYALRRGQTRRGPGWIVTTTLARERAAA